MTESNPNPLDHLSTPLPALEADLKQRYPGLIIKAQIFGMEGLIRPTYLIDFFGPCADLLAYGLAEDMGNDELAYDDGMGTTGLGHMEDDVNAWVFHSRYVEGETADPKLPRKEKRGSSRSVS